MSTIAITGINSYFAKTVLPKLEADPEIEKIIGIDVTPWQQDFKKVTFFQEDVRSPNLTQIIQGADTLMHLAFIVQEIHDKKKTHSTNLEGSRNAFQAATANGVQKVIYTSSIAAYGSHRDNFIGIKEDFRLRENPDSYYSSDKVAVERHLAEHFKAYPETVLTVLRPPVIVGPRLTNFAAELYTRKTALYMKDKDTEIQFLHENDLGEALYLSVKKDIPGIYNVAADDYTTNRRIYEIAGVKLIGVSTRTLKFLCNVFFALHVEKMSQGWISLMEYPIIINSDKFKSATGWQPKYTTEEAFRDFLKSRHL